MTDWRTLPFAPPSGTRLCGIGEVPDRQGREFVFGEGRDVFRIVIIRSGARLLAFHNCCPHFSLPLNYEPDCFHLFDEDMLMCAHHTAIFRLSDGRCVDGPCTGSQLTAIAVVSEDGVVKVA